MSYGPSVEIPGYVIDKPLVAQYDVSVKRRGEENWAVVYTGWYYRDRCGRTRKDIIPVLPDEHRASIATVLDLVAKRIVVFDMVHRTVLMDCTDPENPAFESVRCVAKFRPDHGGLEE